jgi:hypothetical protein
MPSKKGRIVRYQGRKLQLSDLVQKLVAAKKRPVCSADLRSYLAGQEEAEVGYIQAFGQILIKAAIPRPGPVLRLYAIGIHRNRTYYATESSAEIHRQFESFCAHERAEYLLKRDYLLCLPKPGQLKADLDKAAAFSLRRIIETTVPHLQHGHLAANLQMWLDNGPCSAWVKPVFNQVDRNGAIEILKEEAAKRAPYIDSMNFNRHLARICPTILKGGAEPVYSEEVVRTYCETLWPLRDENLESATNSLLRWILVMVQIARGDI